MSHAMGASCDGHPRAACAKGSLDFIMNWSEDIDKDEEEDAVTAAAGVYSGEDSQSEFVMPKPQLSEVPALGPTAAVSKSAGMRDRPPTSEEKRHSRECSVEGCKNYIINKGLCFRHGGGKKCSVNDCQSSAKNGGLCWRHGGSVKCLVEGCDRRGKSRGLCWAHGGGTKCSHAKCPKVAVSNGCCWAHGGGKRCVYGNCNKAAYERTNNYCVKHHELLKGGAETMEA